MRLLALALTLIVAGLAGPAAGMGEPGPKRWAWLKGTVWYVPTAYLPAIATSATNPAVIPLRDQTVYTIDGYGYGFFWGVARVQLLEPGDPPKVKPDSPPTCMRLAASVTPEGTLNLAFTPMGSTGDAVTGIGTMRKQDGEWAMELQMTAGGPVKITHWAYMHACPKDGACPLPAIKATAREFVSTCAF